MDKITPFFPFFVLLLFPLISFTLSKRGWSALADVYSTTEPFSGNSLGWISASINKVSYNNSLILKYNEQGFYLRPVIAFRLFHKPLYIPWKEITQVRDKTILFFTSKELSVGTPLVATITLGESTFAKIKDHIGKYEWNRGH